MSESRSTKSSRKPGGQPGNRNALKHGRYMASIREETRKDTRFYESCRALLRFINGNDKEHRFANT